MDSRPDDDLRTELVAQLAWVQRLARAIVRDDGAAEDVAQDVVRVALEHREPIQGSIDGLRAWLAVVARKLAQNRVRADTARERRERAAARAESEDETREAVERGARAHSVVEAVMQLDDPYRATVLMRYLEELPLAEVARRTGATEVTARKRLSRGLEMLRARLDREHGDHGAWLAVLVPLARAPVGGAAAVSSTALVLGGVVMSIKLVVLSGAMVTVAMVAWFAWPRTQAVEPTTAQREAPAVNTPAQPAKAVASALPVSAPLAAPAPEVPNARTSAADATAVAATTTTTLVVICRARETGAPLAGIDATLAPMDPKPGALAHPAGTRGQLGDYLTTAEEGRVEFEIPAGVQAQLYLSSKQHGLTQSMTREIAALAIGEHRELAVELLTRDDGRFCIRVLARETKSPCAGAQVIIEGAKNSNMHCDADGRFDVACASWAPKQLRIHLTGFADAVARTGTSHESPDKALELLLERGATLIGVLEGTPDATDKPITFDVMTDERWHLAQTRPREESRRMSP